MEALLQVGEFLGLRHQTTAQWTDSSRWMTNTVNCLPIQVENKNDLIQKLETENSSLTRQLNDKSSTLERFQSELMKVSSELDKKKREVMPQILSCRLVDRKLYHYCALY